VIFAKLIRRREIWVPTIRGWFVLLAIVGAMFVLGVRSLHPFLAVNQPVGARILVVEGWMEPDGLDQAIATFRSGRYERIVTTGGPIGWAGFHGSSTFAERAAGYLRQQGIAEAVVTAVPTPETTRERTYLSAVMVREWARNSGISLDALDVFSSGTHARRSRLLYRLAFGPNVAVGVYAARFRDYDAEAWWQTSTGARDVLDQAIGLFWTKCFFQPSAFTAPKD
jgi:hypothetical protein